MVCELESWLQGVGHLASSKAGGSWPCLLYIYYISFRARSCRQNCSRYTKAESAKSRNEMPSKSHSESQRQPRAQRLFLFLDPRLACLPNRVTH